MNNSKYDSRHVSWRQRVLQILVIVGALSMQSMHAMADNSSRDANVIGADPMNFDTPNMVGSDDSADFYQFTLTSRRSVQVQLTDLSGDASLYVFGDNGIWLSSTRRGAGLNENIRKDLEPGRYYIMVYAWAGRVNHRLKVNTWLPPVAGTSQSLGVLDGMNGVRRTLIASGTIQPNVTYMDYAFTLPARRTVTVTGNGNVAAGITPNATPARWNILQNNRLDNVRLAAGNYILRVFRNPNSTQPFSFTLNAKPQHTNDTAGFTQQTARDLGRLGNPPTVVDEYVGQDDFDDFYRVVVNRNSTLNIDFAHTMGQNAYLRVIDPLGRVVPSTANASPGNKNLSLNALNGGVYYLHVGIGDRTGPSWQDAKYRLRVGTVSASAPAGSGPGSIPPANIDPFLSAAALQGVGQIPGSGGGSLTQTGTVVGGSGQNDYYYFNIGCNFSSQRPGFNVNSTGGAVAVTVYDAADSAPRPPIGLNGSGDGKANRNGTNQTIYMMVAPVSAGPTTYSITVTHNGC